MKTKDVRKKGSTSCLVSDAIFLELCLEERKVL
jgi:hypothetical protein